MAQVVLPWLQTLQPAGVGAPVRKQIPSAELILGLLGGLYAPSGGTGGPSLIQTCLDLFLTELSQPWPTLIYFKRHPSFWDYL